MGVYEVKLLEIAFPRVDCKIALRTEENEKMKGIHNLNENRGLHKKKIFIKTNPTLLVSY